MTKVASKAMQGGMARGFAVAFAGMVAVALIITTASATLAATAPAAPVISSPPEGSYDNHGAFKLSGTGPTNSVVKVFEVLADGRTSQLGGAEVSATGQWVLPLQGVAEGTHAYKARATDQASGLLSNWSNTRTVIVDTKAPATPSLKVGSGRSSYTNDELQDGWLGGYAEPGSKVEVFFQDTLVSTVSTGSQSCSIYGEACSNWTTPAVFTLNSANDASYYFKARAKDLAGNVSGWSNTITIRVDCLSSDGCPVSRGRG